MLIGRIGVFLVGRDWRFNMGGGVGSKMGGLQKFWGIRRGVYEKLSGQERGSMKKNGPQPRFVKRL